MTSDVHGTIDALLRRTRQRYTRGRRRLVQLLAEGGRPLTVPDLQRAGATQSLSSLYRNLSILEQCGSVRRLASAGNPVRYELAEGLTAHHHHASCSACGRIEDIVLSAPAETVLVEAAETAAQRASFRVEGHHVELVGTCADCS